MKNIYLKTKQQLFHVFYLLFVSFCICSTIAINFHWFYLSAIIKTNPLLAFCSTNTHVGVAISIKFCVPLRLKATNTNQCAK